MDRNNNQNSARCMERKISFSQIIWSHWSPPDAQVFHHFFFDCVTKIRANTSGKTRNTADFQATSNPLEDIFVAAMLWRNPIVSHICKDGKALDWVVRILIKPKVTRFFFSNIVAFPIFNFKVFFKQKAELRIFNYFLLPYARFGHDWHAGILISVRRLNRRAGSWAP